MTSRFRRFTGIEHLPPYALMVVLAGLLSGCAIAPGMHFSSSNTQYVEEADAKPVTPIIKKITPELLRQEMQAQQAVQPMDDLAELMTPATPYTIGPGDHLAITVWDHPELVMPVTTMTGTTIATLSTTTPTGYTVSADGRIQFPYAGDVAVGGLTEMQARDLLARKLSHYIKKPEITLRVLNYRSQRIYVDGEIKSPGIVPIDDLPLSLPEAINRAGGITALGDQSRIAITRAGKTHWVDLPGLIAAGVDPSRIILASGDLLRIFSRDDSKVFVVGEVINPASLPMRNGRLSLNEALGEVGGINPATANARQIYVIRNANDEHPLVYHLEAESPVMFALAEEFPLRPKDVVYVDATSMVRFNRVISLILPTAQLITHINRGFE
ncbi:MAG: polysaccharide biosynthesis/export family protein [Thiobacillus sp.]|uniref:polysaccharide biosynthesis/export family protein n=1 Tax=Thiobacillus sp. TaxID=924 RepID=UPI0028947DF3|nr:polysaccharide biosynthesis/export family protein [Thiobacillus sp.]MDT3708482.1 polysaccharide biosynthesis/export family protein [Thiobacillus sp.]